MRNPSGIDANFVFHPVNRPAALTVKERSRYAIEIFLHCDSTVRLIKKAGIGNIHIIVREIISESDKEALYQIGIVAAYASKDFILNKTMTDIAKRATPLPEITGGDKKPAVSPGI